MTKLFVYLLIISVFAIQLINSIPFAIDSTIPARNSNIDHLKELNGIASVLLNDYNVNQNYPELTVSISSNDEANIGADDWEDLSDAIDAALNEYNAYNRPTMKKPIVKGTNVKISNETINKSSNLNSDAVLETTISPKNIDDSNKKTNTNSSIVIEDKLDLIEMTKKPLTTVFINEPAEMAKNPIENVTTETVTNSPNSPSSHQEVQDVPLEVTEMSTATIAETESTPSDLNDQQTEIMEIQKPLVTMITTTDLDNEDFVPTYKVQVAPVNETSISVSVIKLNDTSNFTSTEEIGGIRTAIVKDLQSDLMENADISIHLYVNPDITNSTDLKQRIKVAINELNKYEYKTTTVDGLLALQSDTTTTTTASYETNSVTEDDSEEDSNEEDSSEDSS